MNQQLAVESERLRRSWARHPADKLRDYLVADIHDPRLNPQSIRGRHFLSEALFGDRFAVLQEEEFRFGAVMKWLMDFARQQTTTEDWQVLEHALTHGADSAEGLLLPPFLVRAFGLLPREAHGVLVPNYLLDTIHAAQGPERPAGAIESGLEVFAALWRPLLELERPARISVLEPGCGSANDYRALATYGLATHLDYLGFDLCGQNIANAKTRFPETRFQVGNIFEIDQPARSFDYSIAHDLLEHLSPMGLDAAIAELCRVTRRGLFVGFFQMHEGDEHIVRSVEEYHWNTLSLPRVRALFEQRGARTQAIHVNTWLKAWLGSHDAVYYDSAYDLACWFGIT